MTAQKEGFVTRKPEAITVVLDTKLTPELIEEGFVREIISKIQTMRKEADFEVMDQIGSLSTQGNDEDRMRSWTIRKRSSRMSWRMRSCRKAPTVMRRSGTSTGRR